MKDLFSSNSQLYQQARPSYPATVIQEVLKYVPDRNFAWDCGAGSGQFTQLLTPYFDHIVATDLSENQLQQAPYFENVSYQIQPAEHTSFATYSFDLITVAQAIHWFDFEAFYREVKRTLKPNGVLAVIGYGLIHVEHKIINELIHDVYFNQLNGYWDLERRYIDEEYKTIPFPFDELLTPDLKMQYQWSATQLLDYINTWSAIKHYKNKHEDNPLAQLEAYIKQNQDVNALNIEFPVLLRIGKISA